MWILKSPTRDTSALLSLINSNPPALPVVGDCDGTLISGPVWQPDAGMVTGALQFDGIDDCVVTGSPLNPADGPFSIFAWVNGGAPGQVIVSQQGFADWLTEDADGNLKRELKCIGRFADPLFSETVITDGQ